MSKFARRIPPTHKQRLENNSEAAYRIVAHLKMIDHELEAMRDSNIQDVKRILTKATNFYKDVFRVDLKKHFADKPEVFNYLVEKMDDDKIVSLQALFDKLFHHDTTTIEIIYDDLTEIEMTAIKNHNQNQKTIEYAE
jgi:hypothetical protein